MKPSIPITDSRFAYIPSANHDADSTKFRQRQLERIAAAEKARADAKATEAIVRPIRKPRAEA